MIAIPFGKWGYSSVTRVTMMCVNMSIIGVFCAVSKKEGPASSQNAEEMWLWNILTFLIESRKWGHF